MPERAYFQNLSTALAQAGRYKPTLVIDQARLDANLAAVKAALPPGKAIRLVDKSLSSITLLRYAMTALGTRKLMSFHLPITIAVLEAFPDADILYGKPVPVKALGALVQRCSDAVIQRLFRQTTWLIDSVERLHQYQSLAERLQCQLQFVYEVDIGLRRGGFATSARLREALAQSGRCTHLKCRGLMGYDAQVAELPGLFGGVQVQLANAGHRLARFVECLPETNRQIINTGGSKSILSYPESSPATELSVGSALLKPTDFDLEHLSALAPAAFIATPILKVVDAAIPGPRWLSGLVRLFRKLPGQGCFIYGGHWLAKPVYPRGMALNPLWGESSNQQFMSLPADHQVNADDFAFFRPSQSEAVLQHFGAIALFKEKRMVDYWAPLPTD